MDQSRSMFSEVIALPLEDMLRSKQLSSIDSLLSELTTASRQICTTSRTSSATPVWELSDNCGVLRVKRDLWQGVKKFFLRDFAERFEALERFSVKDMRGEFSEPLTLPSDRRRKVLVALGLISK